MLNMKAKGGQQNRFVRITTTPIRALGKARDMYVKSMTDYADRVNYYSNITKFVRVSRASGLPKSFSVNPAWSYDSEDFRELIPVASARSLGTRVDLDVYMKQQTKARAAEPGSGVWAGLPPRSSSVAMGRIDENKACSSFAEENDVSNLKNELKKAPRSKSYVVRRGLAAF